VVTWPCLGARGAAGTLDHGAGHLHASSASRRTVTVAWSTAAAPPPRVDYVSGSGTLVFAPGETSKTIALVVNGDGLWEPDETLLVTLSAPDGATDGHSERDP
jgi:chitinase